MKVIWRLLIISSLIISFQIILQTQNGSKVIYRDNFAIVQGTMEITMTKDMEQVYTGTKYINYPQGYTVDNSIVVAIGAKVNGENKQYGYGSITETGTALNRGIIEKGITLTNSNLLLYCRYDGLNLGGIASETKKETIIFKIILMKLPELIEGKDYVLGDVNQDGQITQNDLTLVQSYIQGTQALTDIQLKAADVNKDGKIDSGDTFKLSQYVNGIIDSF